MVVTDTVLVPRGVSIVFPLYGMSIVPWANGRILLVWDASCSDTFAASNIGLAFAKAGAVAEKAEQLKMLKCV